MNREKNKPPLRSELDEVSGVLGRWSSIYFDLVIKGRSLEAETAMRVYAQNTTRDIAALLRLFVMPMNRRPSAREIESLRERVYQALSEAERVDDCEHAPKRGRKS